MSLIMTAEGWQQLSWPDETMRRPTPPALMNTWEPSYDRLKAREAEANAAKYVEPPYGYRGELPSPEVKAYIAYLVEENSQMAYARELRRGEIHDEMTYEEWKLIGHNSGARMPLRLGKG
jgi:hypothetical protein